MRVSTFYIANFIATISAFTITSPTAGQKIDPTQPITFSWEFNATDPAAFNIYLNQPGGLTQNAQIATDVSTFALSYIIPAGAVKSYGVNFTLIAEATIGGAFLANSANFTLSMATSSSSTFTGSVTEGEASATNAASASATTTNESATTGAASASGTTSATGSNSFTTSTVSRSGSSTGTSASSAASATSSQNAQPKLGSKSQMAFTAAGFIAGLAALMA